MAEIFTEREKDGYGAYLLFIILLYFFALRSWLETIAPGVGYVDEVVAALAFPIFIVRTIKNNCVIKTELGGYGLFIVLFLLTGLAGSVLYHYQEAKAAWGDLFLCTKFWLVIYVGKHVFAGMDLAKYGRRISAHVRLIALALFVLCILDLTLHIFTASERYGLRSEKLMYFHPTDLAAVCVFLVMVLLSVKERCKHYLLWLGILLFLQCSTLRSKAIGTAMLTVLFCYLVFYRKKSVRLRTFLWLLPVVVIIGWGQIEFYFFGETQAESARYQLLLQSFAVAKDHFPFGTGFATYGSHFSSVYYSPVYRMYGLNKVWGLAEDQVGFVSDTFWPMILGQTGYLGCLFYIGAVVMLFLKIQRLKEQSSTAYAAALVGIFYTIILSTAGSAFVHPNLMPIALLFGILFRAGDKAHERGIANAPS